MEITAQIAPRKIEALRHAVEKVNGKAARMGVEPLTLEIGEVMERKENGRVILYHDATITGTLPKIGGWTVVARIDHTGPRNIIVSTGEIEAEIDPKWRTAEPNCDHCEHQRVRNDTFLLVNEAGEWKQVGRNCLSDFAGSDSPWKILRLFLEMGRIVGNLEDEGSERSASPYIVTAEYLAHVVALVTEHGWYSRSAHRDNNSVGTPTADRAFANMFASEEEIKKGYTIPVTDDHRSEAEAAIQWVRDEMAGKENPNDYEYNLLAVTEEDYFNGERYTGLVASIVPAYRRSKGLDQRGERKEIVSTHQGKVGKREDWTLTVTKRVDMEVEGYGYNRIEMLHIHIMEDEAGNVFVWKTTSRKLAEGKTYVVKATVKDHGEYNGTPQTILTRAKITCPDCGKDPLDEKLWDSVVIEEQYPGAVDAVRNVNLYELDECWHCWLTTQAKGEQKGVS